jgi:hypothetical protein
MTSRDIYDGTDFQDIPVIQDSKVFGYETNTLNFLAPMVRRPEHGHIFFDDLYVIHFLIKERNAKNRALYNAYKTSGKLDMVKKLIQSNYDITDHGSIKSFWEVLRNGDYALASVSKKRTGMSFYTTKAFVFPCFVGNVEAGDASAAHVVLFVAYVDKNVREIWMYDSMIYGETAKEMNRFDHSMIETISELKFTHNEPEYDVGVQKIFHLIESYVHCLELLETRNEDNKHMLAQPVLMSRKEITHFCPSNYKFFITGYGPRMKQRGYNCSAFTVHGMYNLLQNWKNPLIPHRMQMKHYDEIHRFPLLTINQFIAGNVCAFINKTVIFDKKNNPDRNTSVFIMTNSLIREDYELKKDVHDIIQRNIKYYVQTLDVHEIALIDCEPSSVDMISKKDIVVFIYDRLFENSESIQSTKSMLERIIGTTKCIVIIYFGQVIQYISNVKPAFDANISTEYGMITYPMTPGCKTIFRHESDAFSLMNCVPSIPTLKTKMFKHISFSDLPPSSVTHMMKVLDGGFVPFVM